jgi:hypothetical protein
MHVNPGEDGLAMSSWWNLGHSKKWIMELDGIVDHHGLP